MTPTNSNTTAHLAAFLTILCLGTTFVSSKVLLRVFMPVSCPKKSSYVPVCQLAKGIYLFK